MNIRGDISVDYLLRFESLDQDFNYLCDKLKIDAKLPKINSSSHDYYKTYYNEETKKIVRNLFKKDIELFNYEF